MADIIKVNTRSLKNDRDSIQKDLQKVRKKIAEMQKDVEALNKMWSGDANAAFNQVFKNDIKALESICKSIDGMIQYETTAKKEYDTCEGKVSELISSIQV
ncbi:MAG: WXG100 family type VII secretion target [Lachnospiraceae bacterium]|nr:WXG100 family type VII secretion target [Lachnospiraceae bacterium]